MIKKIITVLIFTVTAAGAVCPVRLFAEAGDESKKQAVQEDSMSPGLVKLLAAEEDKEDVKARVESLMRLSAALRKLKESTNLE